MHQHVNDFISDTLLNFTYYFVREGTEIILQKDSRVGKLLSLNNLAGDTFCVRCIPYSTSSSTIQDKDGKARKHCRISMHVVQESGSRRDAESVSIGTVSIEATLLDKDMSVNNKFSRVRFSSVLFKSNDRSESIWKIESDKLQSVKEIIL